MASPVVVANGASFNNTANTLGVVIDGQIKAGDIIQVAADTNNGAAVTGVTGVGLGVFSLIGRGFSLSVWQFQVLADQIDAVMTLTYNIQYNTTSCIAVLIRGCDPTTPYDPNVSLPSIETGNPAPPDAVFSTTNADDLLLFWIGCDVGFGGAKPWEDPVLTGNSVGPGVWDWINGLNNTDLLAPIALTVYQQSVSTPQTNENVGTNATMFGAAYLVTALTANATPTGNGQVIPVFLPPPISSPCIQPCRVVIDEGSHAYGMYYGNSTIPHGS
jgi:hypothetical protein